MRRKTATIHVAVLLLIAVPPMAAVASAFAQRDYNAERQSTENANRAEALFQSALRSFDKQENESARRQLQEAFRLWVGLREPARAAQAALQIGDHARQAKKYQEALGYYRQALAIKAIPDGIRANALNATARVYADLYLHDMAARYFNQALSEARTGNDLAAQTVALTGLAEVYHQAGAREKASGLITQALRLSRKGQAAADPALLFLKGRISQEQGRLDDAKGAFEEALTIYRKADNVAGQVNVLCALSALSLLDSHKQGALDQAEQALALAETQWKHAVEHSDYLNAFELRWRARLSRARAERALGDNEHALRSYFLAISYSHAVWWGAYIATEASAIAFKEEVQTAYREYVDLLVEQGQIKKAYNSTDEARSRTLLNFTGARRVHPQTEDPKQAAARRELSQSVIRLRLQLLGPRLSREQRARLQSDIEKAEAEMREAELQAEMQHYQDRLVWSELATAEQMQKQMAADHMTLAEFSLGETRSFLWLFTRGEIFFEVLPARKQIEQAVRAYLGLLANPPSPIYIEREIAKTKAQAESLFAILFGSLAKQINAGERLVIVPDGLLHYLPFEALIHNGHYLVEDHEISYNPSASMMGLWRDAGSRRDDRDKLELLAVGDPVLEPAAKGRKGKRVVGGLTRLTEQMLDARGFHLTPLAGAEDEIQTIAGFFPADRRRVLLGRACTEEAVKRESLRRYRRLHFASHSVIDEKSPTRSAVVLTPGNAAEEDGLLNVDEIARLELDADLVVVSACQTGRGQLRSGEGIVGLSRAFLYAGARSVIVSLWNVSDNSTAQLMKTFYQQLAGGMTNAAALRRAKLQLLGGKQTRHPYYWSPFVMVGKP